MTVRPLVRILKLPEDTLVEREVHRTRKSMARAALKALEGKKSLAAEALRIEFSDVLEATRDQPSHEPGVDTEHASLRREVLEAQRRTLSRLLADREIGDDAYRRIEEELDWAELFATRSGSSDV
jgi:CPA1 family monovalent cation:H+ antiporter